MVWIDQPIGTGLSSAAPGGPAMIKNETAVAADFAGFWENFIKLFGMQGYKVYITGERFVNTQTAICSSEQYATWLLILIGIQLRWTIHPIHCGPHVGSE